MVKEPDIMKGIIRELWRSIFLAQIQLMVREEQDLNLEPPAFRPSALTTPSMQMPGGVRFQISCSPLFVQIRFLTGWLGLTWNRD